MQVFVTIYVSLIVAGRRTVDQVLANIREDVKADLVALGYEQ
ncbi:CD1375 family protein [Paenibacillus taichungensis]|nr:CD1375 family protein [Paenibacillus taichungensis]